MNKFPAILTATLMLGACVGSLGSPVRSDGDRLDACTAEESPFAIVPPSKWIETYHETVDDVIESHLESLQDINTAALRCTAGDYASLVEPTAALRDLAASLPAWNSDARKKALSEAEIGPVLLEYLRIYECALNERRNFLNILIPKEWYGSGSSASSEKLTRDVANKSAAEQQRMIDHELLLARPTLDRTLQILGGYDRLRPLSLDVECLKRTSLDIRNLLGLVSQASACLPRIRDARGSLRDLPDLPTP